MKRRFLVVAIALCATAACAQTDATFFNAAKSDAPITYGIRAGLNFNNLSVDNESTDASLGFRLGAEADIPVLKSLHIVPGLYFSTRPSKHDGIKYNPYYLELPVLASYRYAFNQEWTLRVDLGPYFAYGLGGKAKYDDGDDEELFKEYKDDDSSYQALDRFDYGLAVGVSGIYRQFLLGVNYQVGLAKSGDMKAKNRGLYITLGYNF